MSLRSETTGQNEKRRVEAKTEASSEPDQAGTSDQVTILVEGFPLLL